MVNTKQDNKGDLIKKAVILSFIIAIVVEAYILYETRKEENYATLYLFPDSYSNYLDGNTVKFTYGIRQFGERSSKYILEVYMGDTLVATKDLKQRIGENEIVLQLPEAFKFPTKVRLVLKTDYGKNEVHFWLKGRKDENLTKQ